MKAELVEIRNILTKLVFKETNNPFEKKIYPDNARAYIDIVAYTKLQNINDELKSKGLTLIIGDAYRPLKYQTLMTNMIQDDKYVSSVDVAYHCRGIAVDVSILDSNLDMIKLPPIGYNETSHHGTYNDLDDEQINNREMLKSLMEKHGFESYKYEWWHYNMLGWEDYEILDIDFDCLSTFPISCPIISSVS